MVGQELRQVTRTNEGVDRAMFAGELPDVLACAGRDDAVVRADLGVVPCSRTALRVDMRHQLVHRRIRTAQRCENLRRVAVLA